MKFFNLFIAVQIFCILSLAGCSKETDYEIVVKELLDGANYNIDGIKLQKLQDKKRFVCGKLNYKSWGSYNGVRRFVGDFEEMKIWEDNSSELIGRKKINKGDCKLLEAIVDSSPEDVFVRMKKIESCTTEEIQEKLELYTTQWKKAGCDPID